MSDVKVECTNREFTAAVAKYWGEAEYPSTPVTSWDSWNLAHRITLPMAVSCTGAKSLYEIGCGAGPNLRLLRSEKPEMALGGCDVRQEYVDWCHKEGFCNVDFGTVPHKVLSHSQWDVVLSCYVMAYVDPETAIEQLNSIESPSLILMEPEGKGDLIGLIQHGERSIPRWYHNYKHLLEQTGWVMQWRWPIEGRDNLYTLVIANRG